MWGLSSNQDNDTWQVPCHVAVPCHVSLTMPRVTKDLTCGKVFNKKIQKKNSKKLKNPEADTWHVVNGICEKLTECTILMHNFEFGYSIETNLKVGTILKF